jgi:hypothetical protein
VEYRADISLLSTMNDEMIPMKEQEDIQATILKDSAEQRGAGLAFGVVIQLSFHTLCFD